MFDLHPGFSRALLEALPGGVAFIDRHDRVQWVNEEFAALLGTDRSRLLGRAAHTLPFPSLEVPPRSDQYRMVGDLLLTERRLCEEPMIGRLLQILPRKPVQAALPATARGLSDLPVPTGVLSRDTGLQRLSVEISRSRRYENPLSCLIGRAEGYDEQATRRGLGTLTTLLKEQLRWVDVLVQWEVDRLLVVLPETGADAAYRLLRKLAQLIDDSWPAEVTDVRVHWGSSTWRRGDDTLRMVRRAEAASLAHSPGWSGSVSRLDP